MNFSIEFDEVKNAVSKLQESADKMQDFRARLHEAALECVILSGGVSERCFCTCGRELSGGRLLLPY